MDAQLLRTYRRRAKTRKALADPKMRRWLRLKAGLTQQQVADVVGVHRMTVARWETGERHPGRHLDEYFQVLGVELDEEDVA